MARSGVKVARSGVKVAPNWIAVAHWVAVALGCSGSHWVAVAHNGSQQLSGEVEVACSGERRFLPHANYPYSWNEV